MEINECQPVTVDMSKEIFLGQAVSNKDEAYNLYQEHAFKKGFSVRKGKELYYDNVIKKTHAQKSIIVPNKGLRTINFEVKYLMKGQIQEQIAKLW